MDSASSIANYLRGSTKYRPEVCLTFLVSLDGFNCQLYFVCSKKQLISVYHSIFFLQVGIICGSGLSGISKSFENSETFEYDNIPCFPRATVPGHTGELVFGTMGGVQCVCMRGRFHYYEGR